MKKLQLQLSNRKIIARLKWFLCILLILSLSSCKKDNDNSADSQYDRIKPKKPVYPWWAPGATQQMLALIEVYDSMTPLTYHGMNAEDSRKFPYVNDAAIRLMRNYGIS